MVGSGRNSWTKIRSSPISPDSSPVAPLFSSPVLPSSPDPQHFTMLVFVRAQAKASPTSTAVAWMSLPRPSVGR